ncbi:hypothetical protein EIP91_006023 [Steccherinum ochraceum]|uniref:Uncharacterized protein n=1 Tax=Steccherinum ochraceum TaxID=92696 RepID=A0A4V2MVL5_9APHY|nr:hypothetical protein EIP91_006023 [Steccherinum ochraceum]
MSEALRQRFPSNVASIHEDSSEKIVIKQSLTISWSELPEWRKDNEYIVEGHRRTQYSWRGCLASVYGFNIHSHLLGAVLFAWLLGSFRQVYFVHYEHTTWKDSTVFAIFLGAAILCLSGSAFYHTTCVHSESVSKRCNTIDYAGIVVLIVGSFFPCVYYGFYCDPHWQTLYLLAITIAGAGAAYIVLNPEYSQPTHRHARTTVFAALGLCGVLPVLHGIFAQGFTKMIFEMGYAWLLLSGALYFVGALL